MMKVFVAVSVFVSLFLLFPGYRSSGNHFGRLERDLAQALARYENSESKFSPSTRDVADG